MRLWSTLIGSFAFFSAAAWILRQLPQPAWTAVMGAFIAWHLFRHGSWR